MTQEVLNAMQADLQRIVNENLVAGQQNPLAQAVRRMALTEGQVLHIAHTVDENGASTLRPDHIQNPDGTVGNAFFGYDTAEEIVLTTSQICRRGNGLHLQGGTQEAMLLDFCVHVERAYERAAAAGNTAFNGPALRVTELRTRPGRNGVQVIPIFAVPADWNPTDADQN